MKRARESKPFDWWVSLPGESWTIPLGRLRPRHIPEAGTKAVTLGKLLQAGLPVPDGFVATASAFEKSVRSLTEWGPALESLEQAAGTESPPVQLSRRCQEALARAQMPLAVERAVRRAIVGAPGPWAVRSSATAEDLPEASFAGQYASFLHVPSSEVLDKVRQCWTSLFGPRAVAYRARNHISHRPVRMAVIVQQMVPAEKAGVLFTADPVSGDGNCIVIEGARGLGDQVVSGHVAPERVVLSRFLFGVLERTAGGDRSGMILDDALARRLAELGLQANGILGGPLDIEWAVAGGQIYLLQARPITGNAQADTWEARQVWSNLNAGEVLPDVLTPLTWSGIQGLVEPVAYSLFQLLGADIRSSPILGLVAGRAYFNINTVLATLRPFAFLLRASHDAGRSLGGGEVEVSRRLAESIPDRDLPDLGFRWSKYLLSWPSLLLELLRHSPRRGDAWTLRLEARAGELARIQVDAMLTPDLPGFILRVLREALGRLDLRYLITQAAALPVLEFAFRKWLDDPKGAVGYRLFSGLGGVAEAEAGLALWRLAQFAHSEPRTESALASDASWADTLGALRQTEPGRAFVAQWEEFMAEHGHHARTELDPYNPRWSETPDYILGQVRGYLRSIDRINPLERQRRLGEERRQLTEQCLRRLRNPLKRWIFSRALSRAQKLTVNREQWKSEAVRMIAVLRRALLELGRRLRQQGELSDGDDIFFLKVCDIEAIGAGQVIPDLRERIRARRDEYAAHLRLHPPPVLAGRFIPRPPAPPQPTGDENILEGIAVCPGTVTGRAKLILRSDDHEQVLPGEILVAPFTDPAWSPYFLAAAGVAMDQGGVLSHGSIVAREYGLPAVTSLGSATLRIRTGDLIQVDGDRGRVTILERRSGGLGG